MKHWIEVRDKEKREMVAKLLIYQRKFPFVNLTYYYREKRLYDSMVVCVNTKHTYDQFDEYAGLYNNYRHYDRKPKNLCISNLQSDAYSEKYLNEIKEIRMKTLEGLMKRFDSESVLIDNNGDFTEKGWDAYDVLIEFIYDIGLVCGKNMEDIVRTFDSIANE